MSNEHFVTRTDCPACGRLEHHALYECALTESPIREFLEGFYRERGGIEMDRLEGATYVVLECRACGLVYQRDIPDDSLMGLLYEKWIDADVVFQRHREDAFSLYASHAREVMTLVSFFDTLPSRLRFLDFGMGWGKWCLMAKAFGVESFGHELSAKRVAHAQASGIEVIEWDEIPQHQFDFINSEQVFEHLGAPLATLQHLVKALKPHGLIKISVPDGRGIKRLLRAPDWSAPKRSRRSLNAVSPLEHINCFTHAAIVRMGKRAGLEPVRIPLPVQWAHATDWRLLSPALKNLLRPVYRDVIGRGACVYFRRPHPSP